MFTVSPAAMRNTQSPQTHKQEAISTRHNLHMESHNPQVKEDSTLHINNHKIPADMDIDKPHNLAHKQLAKLLVLTDKPVTQRNTRKSHMDNQGPLSTTLDLNMEGQHPQIKKDRELLTISQQTPPGIPSQVRDNPLILQ